MAARFDTRLISVPVGDGLSDQAKSLVLATAAKEGVAELIRSGQAAAKYQRFVDGVEGAPEESVRPTGAIAYRFSSIGEAVMVALDYLQTHSPVRSGTYKRSFMVSVDGRPIPAAQFQPDSVPSGATVFIYNTQPYSRKIDVQTSGRRTLHFSVPAGLFDAAAKAVGGRFGNTYNARRLYTLKFPGQEVTKRGNAVDYPAIEITLR